MYSVKPIITYEERIDLPNCMYKVKNLHCEESLSEGSNENLTTNSNNVSLQVNIILKNQVLEMQKLEERQLQILKQLADLKIQMLSMKEALLKNGHSEPSPQIKIEDFTPIVLFANPSQIPYSLLAVQKHWMKKNLYLDVKSYVHSSVSSLTSEAKDFIEKLTVPITNAKYVLNVTFIWKDVSSGPELVIGSTMIYPIKGEVNILRYLNYIAPGVIETVEYETDPILDVCFRLSKVQTQKETRELLRFLNNKLGKNTWICNSKNMSLADIAVTSTLKQLNCQDITQNMNKWLARCTDIVCY